MLRKPLYILIALFLASCVTTPATNAPIPPASTFTLLPLPSATVTLSPSPATPTETRDPNMPPGATGKDAQGNYIKTVTENGKQVTYTSEAVPTGSKGETKNMWVTSHVINPTFNGGIPAIDQPADGYEPGISIQFEVKEGIQAPFIQHANNLDSSNNINFTRLLYGTLMERYFGKNLLKISNTDQVQFGKDWNAGKLSIPVTDANGNTYDLPINDNTRANIILVNPEDITTSDYQDKFINSTTTFKNGVLTITVASTTPPESLSKDYFTFLILSRLMQIFVTQNQSLDYFKNNKMFIISKVDQLDNLAVNGQNPLFTIVTP